MKSFIILFAISLLAEKDTLNVWVNGSVVETTVSELNSSTAKRCMDLHYIVHVLNKK